MSTPAATEETSVSFNIIQPATTYTGGAIQSVRRGLPKTTESLCPECMKIIPALIREESGRVVMEKTCREHGFFKDTVYSDAELYLKVEEWTFGDNRGLTNPAIPNARRCPDDCGLCSLHTSHTGLANLDLTNRCNLTCPVCFANANAAGYLYEPDFETVRKMLVAIRSQKPVAGRIIQFSGGEPTIYPRFLDAIRLAKELGFSHVQIATNGIKFIDEEFAHQCKDAGLHSLYLQFDGVSGDVYRRTRGEDLWDKKLRCIENVRAAGLKIILVPTIVKGLNDHQIGGIVRFALDNIDCVSGISFQPVAFTGRIARKELETKRFTLSDFAHAVYDQTGLCHPHRDWFPLSCVTPFSKFIGALRGEEIPTLSCHPHCSLGTYMFVDPYKRATPVTQFIDMGSMLREIELLARRTEKSRFRFFSKISAWNSLRKYFSEDRAPEGLTFSKFLQTLQGMLDKDYGRGQKEKEGFTYKTLMLAGMHFMDAYNYDVERVKRCVIHYGAPDGRLYPFCAYNAGPCYREKIEKDHSIPFEAQIDRLVVGSKGKDGCGGC